MRKVTLAPLVACLFISLQSCVSIGHQVKTGFGSEDCSFPPYTYGGVITSIAMVGVVIVEIPKNPLVVIGGVMLVIDFPLTLAMDTITLPISAIRDVVACTKKRNEETLPASDQDELEIGQSIQLILVQTNAK